MRLRPRLCATTTRTYLSTACCENGKIDCEGHKREVDSVSETVPARGQWIRAGTVPVWHHEAKKDLNVLVVLALPCREKDVGL